MFPTCSDHRFYNEFYLGPKCTTATVSALASQARAIETAISWIVNCVDDHLECNREKPKGTLYPTRLIDVGQIEDFSDVKLCKTSGIGELAPYVTLSHCWGPEGLSFKLLEANLAAFEVQIPWDGMPKTFQDAIIFTRRLREHFEVKYIWIDALCIVQNSKKDWQRESSIMGDIYAQSFCNLAACIGSDSEGGLFSQRDPFASHACEVIAGPGSILGKYASSGMAHFAVEDREGYESEVASSTLLSRGWVLQELRLSPRIIYFTRQQLYWGCPRLFANEKCPSESLPELSKLSQWHMFDTKNANVKKFKDFETIGSRQARLDKTNLSNAGSVYGEGVSDLKEIIDSAEDADDEEYLSSEDDEESTEDLDVNRQHDINYLLSRLPDHDDHEQYRVWMLNVREYTGLCLRYKEDMLVAISAMAKRVQKALRYSDTYVVGLWRRLLPYQMLWNVMERHKSTRPDVYIAPSWSWASVDGVIENTMTMHAMVLSHEAVIEILSVDVEYATDDSFGLVNSASMRIKTYVFKAIVQQTTDTSGYITWKGERIDEGSDLKTLLDIIDGEQRHKNLDRQVLLDLAYSPANPRLFYCIPVIKSLLCDNPSTVNVHGLVLERIDDKRGQYRRCGMFSTGLSTVWGRMFFENQRPKSDFLSECDYEMANDDGRYTISLI